MNRMPNECSGGQITGYPNKLNVGEKDSLVTNEKTGE